MLLSLLRDSRYPPRNLLVQLCGSNLRIDLKLQKLYPEFREIQSLWIEAVSRLRVSDIYLRG
jgi:hypothetical protein